MNYWKREMLGFGLSPEVGDKIRGLSRWNWAPASYTEEITEETGIIICMNCQYNNRMAIKIDTGETFGFSGCKITRLIFPEDIIEIL